MVKNCYKHRQGRIWSISTPLPSGDINPKKTPCQSDHKGVRMSNLKSGLIQMSLKASTELSPEEIRDAMLEAYIPFIDQAGTAGVQVLCFQEVFTQPQFFPSQDARWYAAVEAIPDGPPPV
jgi:hypothetical protein